MKSVNGFWGFINDTSAGKHFQRSGGEFEYVLGVVDVSL